MPTFKVLVWNNAKAEIALTKTGGTEAVVNEVFQHAKAKNDILHTSRYPNHSLLPSLSLF